LAFGLHWLLQGRYRLLLPLGFAYVWFYNAFPLLLVLAAVYVIATLVMERRLAWQALVYPAVGIILGIVINPYFPENVAFIVNHLLPKIGESTIRVGNEWYPYETWTLVVNSGFALAAFVLGALALGWHEKRMERATLVVFALAAVFGVMLFKSRRFVEYFPAFSLVFMALSAAPLLHSWRNKRQQLKYLLPLALLFLLAWPLKTTLTQARDSVAGSSPAGRYADATLWLVDNAPAGATIFQTDWDDFTRLFFYNTGATYIVGLDPTYMELYDADLYEEWVEITRGEVENPSAIIRDRFGAAYVFSDLNHGNFIQKATEDPGLEEVYRDDHAVIFAVAD
jgi:intracellular septation protein A